MSELLTLGGGGRGGYGRNVDRVAEALERQIEASYDTIPYGMLSHTSTHPMRLATAAALRGLVCAPVESCRVLELGCAEGGNLLYLAETYPDATFVGVDLSGVQVDTAAERAALMSLDNLEVIKLDIADLDQSFGTFDYVIAHGVYSWVPPHVQRRVFEICRDHLAPNGVAAVSYNAYPGWYVGGILRTLVLDVTAGITDLVECVGAARAVLERVVSDVNPETPYGALLMQFAHYTLDHPDSYLAHDLLSPVNEPVVHAEFVHRAAAYDLQYVANTDERVDPRPSSVGITTYGDIVTGNAFRTAVLCASGHDLLDTPDPTTILPFAVASSTGSIDDVHLADRSSARFSDRAGKVITTTAPLMKAMFVTLERAWPQSIPLTELTRTIADEIPADAFPAGAPSELFAVAALAVDLHRARAVELSPSPYVVAGHVSDRPASSTAARVAASIGPEVTNQRYDVVELDDLLRFLVIHVDGARDVADIVSAALEAVDQGRLALPDASGAAITDRAVQQRALEGIVPRALEILLDMALLVR